MFGARETIINGPISGIMASIVHGEGQGEVGGLGEETYL